MLENNDEEKLLLKKGVDRMKHISRIYNRILVKRFGFSFRRKVPIFLKIISVCHSPQNVIYSVAACQPMDFQQISFYGEFNRIIS